MWSQWKSLTKKVFTALAAGSLLAPALSLFAPVQAQAAVVTGSSGFISNQGIKYGQAGGIDDLHSVIFRVGLSSNPSFFNLGNTKSQLAIADAWDHSYPNLDNLNRSGALVFLPYGYDPSKYELGYYSPSSRSIRVFTSQSDLDTVIHLPRTTLSTLPLKSWLSGYSFGGQSNTSSFSSLVGNWESHADQVSVQQAAEVWSYILAITGQAANGNKEYEVSQRIDHLISQYASNPDLATLPSADQNQVARGYLALLMTTWRLVPQAYKGVWESKIDAYLTDSKQTPTGSPTSMIIDTMTSIMWTSQPTRLLIPTVDYFQFYTALGSKYTFYNNHSGITPSNTYNIMEEAVKGSLADNPQVSRLSNTWNADNAFDWGASAIAYPYHRFETYGGSPEWEPSQVASAIMNTLTLGDTTGGAVIRGFISVNFDSPLEMYFNSPITPLVLSATPTNKILPADAQVLGQPVDLSVSETVSRGLINFWQGLFEGNPSENKTLQVKLTFTRTASPSEPIPASYSSLYPNLTTTGAEMNQSQFLSFISGQTPITLYDNVSGDHIASGATQDLTYMATMTVTYTSPTTGETKTLTQSSNSSTASFVRAPNPANYIGYTSGVSAFAELQEGTPNNQKFDAMAGVPSNKQLYLGVGGNEFVVDVELEYMKNVKSVWRTYKSYFSGTKSQFMKVGPGGDIPPNTTIGGINVSLYNGGTYTKTWSGSIPNLGHTDHVSGSGTVTAVSTAVPDMSTYDQDLAAAQAYVQQVNSTTKSFTAASDGVTRSQTGWDARITTNSKTIPQTVRVTRSHYKSKRVGSGKHAYTIEVPEHVSATANPSPAGNFTITVTFVVPRDIISGPDSRNVMPGVEDNWKQRVTFDYMRIVKVRVYKLDQGRLTRVSNLFGSSSPTLHATIQSGNPNIFYNIAQMNADGNNVAAQSSLDGRIRYSLAPNQNDTVVWYDGVRSDVSDGMGANDATVAPTSGGMAPKGGGHTNPWGKGDLYTNSVPTTSPTADQPVPGYVATGYSNKADYLDTLTPEWQTFNKQRTEMNTATIISDMLILQTSSGDQSVIYFAKNSQPVESQQQFPEVTATQQQMWNDNPDSAANWSKNQINVGSYNGHYQDTGYGEPNNKKYWGYNEATGQFINDEDTASLAKVTTPLDPNGNALFSPQTSEYFHAGAAAGDGYFSHSGTFINGAGADESFIRPARPSQLYLYGTHNIVPTIPNGAYITGNATAFYKQILSWQAPTPLASDPGLILEPSPYQAAPQPHFDNELGFVVPAQYSNSISKVNNVVIQTPVSTEDAMVIALPSYLDQRTTIPAGGAASLIEQQHLDNIGKANDQAVPTFAPAIVSNLTSVTSSTKNKNVTTTVNTNKVVTVTTTTTNPPIPGAQGVELFNYTGAVQAFIAPASGTYQFQVWGAQGGGASNEFGAQGGAGGYATGAVYLSKGQVAYIYVGGMGGSSVENMERGQAYGGFNGGGPGGESGDNFGALQESGGGGGATDIRVNGNGLSNRVLVAGGGGGLGIWGGDSNQSEYDSGGYGGGEVGGVPYSYYSPPNRFYPLIPSAASQTEGYGLGVGGSGVGLTDSGGGGGGYYGGWAPTNESLNGVWGGGGGGGSSYIGGVSNGNTISGNQVMPSPTGGTELGQTGNGAAVVSYNIPSQVEDTVITVPFTDPDFTQPSLGYGDWQYEANGTVGNSPWSFNGEAGIQANYSSWSNGTTVAPQGSQTAFLQDASSSVSEAINFPDSAVYNLTFYYAARPNYGGQPLDLVLDGKTIQEVPTPTSSGFVYYTSQPFFVTAGVHNIGLEGVGVYDGSTQEDVADLVQDLTLHGTISNLPPKVSTSTSNSSTSSSTSTPVFTYPPSTSTSTSTSGNPNGYDGWTWEQLLGPNWQQFVTVKTETHVSNSSTSSSTTPVVTSSTQVANQTQNDGSWTNGNGSTSSQMTATTTTTTTQVSTNYVTTTSTKQTNVETITTLNTALVQQDLSSLPNTMPDGSWNPIKLAFGVGEPNSPSPASQPMVTTSGGLLNLATFVTLDHSFQVYFPNRGNFAQQPTLEGIAHITHTRGLGYVNNMNTTQYTLQKLVKFGFNVIYDGVLYQADSWISLPVDQSYYDFYTVLANSEASGAKVQFEAIPINGQPVGDPVNDNYLTSTNRHRFEDYGAYEGAYKKSYVDVVGRIGNLAITNSQDFRYSNIFKEPLTPTQWFIDGLVKKVNPMEQNEYFGDLGTIRGTSLADSRGYNLNTYGTQPWEGKVPLPLPVSPLANPVPALRDNYMKVGYALYGSVQTLGNYQNGKLIILPYYYKLNIDTGKLTPLDVYEQVNSTYEPVNLYEGADNGTLPSNLYNFPITMNWDRQAPIEDYTLQEAALTNLVSQTYGQYLYGQQPDASGVPTKSVLGVVPMTVPSGSYTNLGNAQRIIVGPDLRTFIGTSDTEGQNEDPGNVLPEIQYNYAAQKWYFKIALPASSVFVPAGEKPTAQNIAQVQSGNAVLVLAADIESEGDVYTLRWNEPGVSSFTVSKDGVTRTFNFSSVGIPPVLALYDLNTNESIDIGIRGTH